MKSVAFSVVIGALISLAIAQNRAAVANRPAPVPNKCRGPHQVFQECGTACEATCENPNPQICPEMCKQGCFCQPGYVKDAQGNCVEPKNCKCTKPNQVFKQCGSDCEPTCTNPKPSGVCNRKCVQGCFCKPGYYSHGNGNCLKYEECQALVDPAPVNPDEPVSSPGFEGCKDNEEYTDCGSACPPTCSDQEPKMCTMQCVQGCQCKEGLVRNDEGECVPKEKCGRARSITTTRKPSGKCGSNEEFVECRTACEPACNKSQAQACIAMCMPAGCQCKRGFVRNVNGQCVLPADCQRNGTKLTGQCSANERWSNESCVPPPGCQARCPNLPRRMCKIRCQGGGCVCKPNFFRDAEGNCIPRQDCDRQTSQGDSSSGSSGKVTCNPPCARGQVCRQVQCFRAPCPPLCMEA